MKSSLLALVFVISSLFFAQSAYANPENVPQKIGKIGERNQAENLVTEPATLIGKWNQVVDQTNNSQENPHSIVVVREQECKKINPLDLIKDPSAIFKECPISTNKRTSQNTEPVEYLKFPHLDSGLSVTVTQF